MEVASMGERNATGWTVGVVFGVAALTAAVPASPCTVIAAPAESEHAIRRALGLLPRRPSQVWVLGEESIALPDREKFRRSEAFVTRASPVVYVTRHSPVLRAAQQGSSVHVHALAAILWHEMAHLDGADEAEARRREASLWTTFVRDDRVDRAAGLRYLKAMRDRRR
jgi:hypothetical protein